MHRYRNHVYFSRIGPASFHLCCFHPFKCLRRPNIFFPICDRKVFFTDRFQEAQYRTKLCKQKLILQQTVFCLLCFLFPFSRGTFILNSTLCSQTERRINEYHSQFRDVSDRDLSFQSQYHCIEPENVFFSVFR